MCIRIQKSAAAERTRQPVSSKHTATIMEEPEQGTAMRHLWQAYASAEAAPVLVGEAWGVADAVARPLPGASSSSAHQRRLSFLAGENHSHAHAGPMDKKAVARELYDRARTAFREANLPGALSLAERSLALCRLPGCDRLRRRIKVPPPPSSLPSPPTRLNLSIAHNTAQHT